MDSGTGLRPNPRWSVPRPEAPTEPDLPAARPGGAAWHVQQARRALAVATDASADPAAPPLRAVPGHGRRLRSFRAAQLLVTSVLALAALAVRPQAVGGVWGAPGDALLAGIAAAGFLYHRRVVAPTERFRLEDAALPVATMAALGTVLGVTSDTVLAAAAVVVAAALLWLLPSLLRDGGGELRRLGREVTGLVILVPVLAAVTGTEVPGGARAGLAAAAGGLVAFDGVRVQGLGTARAALAALSVAAALAGAAAIAPVVGGHAAAAAALLLFWYGTRGVAGHTAAGDLVRPLLVEYGSFIGAAAVLLGLSGGPDR